MGRLQVFVSILIWSIVSGGCALPQYAERYYFEEGTATVAYADRYAGHAESLVHSLRINLRRAPEFGIRMPDGVWISSRETTFPILALHGLDMHTIGQDKTATWHPSFTPGALVGRHAYMSFYEGAARLEVGACGWSFEEIFRAPDGQRVFGFPIAVKELEELFGPPSRVDRVAIVTGHTCF